MKKIVLIAVLASLSFTGCKNKKEDNNDAVMPETPMMEAAESTMTPKMVTATLNPKSDSNVSGTVTFEEENGVVNMTAKMSGLEPGVHAIHLHESSDCSSPDGKSAGGHWNPTAQPHGKWGDANGYHKGDIGNFTADADGNATVTFSTDEWCIGCDDPNKNIIGKGVIVHAGADDYTSQPSGAAGARVSCAGIIEVK
ncbi:superoxide dismutase family protein [Gaetbulibacter aestuarii]|uniref:Superoxide dismutase family protein n=1 Tax=Gaetbulibacter aestuarii TaxID=1502358 RepID=A0ABW7MY41_9FLAO